MIVRCKSVALDREQLALVGKPFSATQAALLELDKEYVVYGLQFETQSLIWGTGVWLQVAAEERIAFAPVCLFDVVEGHVSRHWDLRTWEDGSVTLWPPSFYADYYHDDLTAKKKDVVEDFRQVREVLEREARGDKSLT